jgi:hypothetical protein
VRAYIYKHPSGDDPIEIVPLEEEMVFGELMVQKVGMVVTTFMKYAYTTLVLHVLKNAMLMIHMLEGMLSFPSIVSSNLFYNLVSK